MGSSAAVAQDYLELARIGEQVVGMQDARALDDLAPVGFGGLEFAGGTHKGVLGRNRGAAMAAVFYPDTGLWSLCLVEGYGTECAIHGDAVLSAWWEEQERQAAADDVAILTAKQNRKQVYPDVSKRFKNGRTISTFAVRGYPDTGPQIVISGDRFNSVKHPCLNGDM